MPKFNNKPVPAQNTDLINEYASIVCSYAQKPGTPKNDMPKLYLRFDDCYRAMNGEGRLVHNEDCQPVKNIGRFRFCHSPHYIPELEIMRGLDEKEMQENREALRLAKRGYQPYCLGRYVDQWFDADEKLELVDYTKNCGEIINELEKVERACQAFIKDAYRVVGEKSPFGAEKFAVGYDKNLSKEVDEAVKDLNHTVFPAIDDLSQYIMLFDEDFLQTKSVLTGLTNNLITVEQDVDGIKKAVDQSPRKKEMPLYEPLKTQIAKTKEMLALALEEVNSWKLETHHLITKNSYLVCRCGGFISIFDSGQSFDDLCDRIQKGAEDLKDAMKAECERWHQNAIEMTVHKAETEAYMEKMTQERNSAQALQKIKELESSVNLDPDIETIDDMRNGIFLEYWSHAYFEELESKGVGYLTLATLLCKEPANSIMSLALYMYECYKEGGLDRLVNLGDLYSAESFVAEPIIKQTFPKKSIALYESLSSAFGAAVSLVSAVAAFNYTSNATWIEEISITFFTDDYAVRVSQKFNENAYKRGKLNFERLLYSEYLESFKSDQVKKKMEDALT